MAGAEAIIAEHAQQRGGGSNKKAMAAACFRLAQHLEGQEERDVLQVMEYYAKVRETWMWGLFICMYDCMCVYVCIIY